MHAATYAASVRLLVRTEVGLVVVIAVSVLVSYVGLAIFVSGEHRFAGFLVLVGGLWSLVGAPVVHDRLHREHGEDPHVIWGRGDRRKPPWWPAGRP
jgi:membrane protein YdbS with pleckstrin-like domain